VRDRSPRPPTRPLAAARLLAAALTGLAGCASEYVREPHPSTGLSLAADLATAVEDRSEDPALDASTYTALERAADVTNMAAYWVRLTAVAPVWLTVVGTVGLVEQLALLPVNLLWVPVTGHPVIGLDATERHLNLVGLPFICLTYPPELHHPEVQDADLAEARSHCWGEVMRAAVGEASQ